MDSAIYGSRTGIPPLLGSARRSSCQMVGRQFWSRLRHHAWICILTVCIPVAKHERGRLAPITVVPLNTTSVACIGGALGSAGPTSRDSGLDSFLHQAPFVAFR